MIFFDQTFAYVLYCAAKKNFQRPAIFINSRYYTYEEFFMLATIFAQNFQYHECEHVAILVSRSIYSYVGMLACWLSGKVYVPLQEKDSVDRIKMVFQKAQAEILFVDEANNEKAKLLMAQLPNAHQITIIYCEKIAHFSKNNVNVSYSENAYLMFTSGSSGPPKAVMITHHQLKAFIKNMVVRCQINASDRCTQITPLTFDFSIYEICACFAVGACLYVIPEQAILKIPVFIAQYKISFFACVPSTIRFLLHAKRLQACHFSSLRYSMFCGERLEQSVAQCWHRVAPYSVIDNLYGPTEATVAITAYQWQEDNQYSIVPIGFPFSDQAIKIIDASGLSVQDGMVGELLISGTQVIQSYWNQNVLNKKHFMVSDQKIWYCTGDFVLLDQKVGLRYQGRIDDQIKIRGYRVEKSEIELIIARIAETPSVAVCFEEISEVPKIKAFVAGSLEKSDALLKKCRTELPSYMVPDELYILDCLPYNRNGKVDYQLLNK